MDHQQPATILLVEDDAGHAVLIEKNLRRAGIANEIIVLDNGQKAVDFLFQEGDYRGSPQPVSPLILLDLNLPVLDGFQVLRILKNDDRTMHIPVIIVTTTDLPHEIARCYQLGCSIYITKPVEYEAFCDAIRKLGLFLSVIKVAGAED
jgi:CheY-like chemotaxis protein